MKFLMTMMQVIGGLMVFIAFFRDMLPSAYALLAYNTDPVALSIITGGGILLYGGYIMRNQMNIRRLEGAIVELDDIVGWVNDRRKPGE